jgi:hypothetical protein
VTTRTLILVAVVTPRPEQGGYVRAEAERILATELREKSYVTNVTATILSEGSLAAELADEVLRLRLALELGSKR